MLHVHHCKSGMVENVHTRLSVGSVMHGMNKKIIVSLKLKYVARMVNGMEYNVYASQPIMSSMDTVNNVHLVPGMMGPNVHWLRVVNV